MSLKRKPDEREGRITITFLLKTTELGTKRRGRVFLEENDKTWVVSDRAFPGKRGMEGETVPRVLGGGEERWPHEEWQFVHMLEEIKDGATLREKLLEKCQTVGHIVGGVGP